MPTLNAEEDEAHQGSGKKHRKPRSEGRRNQHVNVRARVAACDEQDGNGRDDDREQSHPPHDPPELPQQRQSRNRKRIGTGSGLGHGLPFGGAKWDYQGLRGASPKGLEMSIQAILGDKGREVATIGADARLSEAVRVLGEKRIGALPVVEDGRIVGIMSERDVIYCLKDHGAEVLDWPVSRVMSSPAITVDPSTEVLSALALITQKRVRHLPVVSGGELIGIVSIGDLVKHRIERIEFEAQAMRDYIQSV